MLLNFWRLLCKHKTVLTYILIFCAFVLLDNSLVMAADSASSVATSQMTGLINGSMWGDAFGSSFQNTFTNIFTGFIKIAQIIAVIMTVVAGLMIALNVQGVNQTVLSWLFGIGCAMNFASVGLDLFDFIWTDIQTAPTINETALEEKISSMTQLATAEDGSTESKEAYIDVLTPFITYYSAYVVIPAYDRLMPIAAGLTIFLWTIDNSVKLALNLIAGDKINYLIKSVLKVGFYLFLITNWWMSDAHPSNLQVANTLGTGFQQLGYYASAGDNLGFDMDVIKKIGDGTATYDESKKQVIIDGKPVDPVVLQANDIVNNSFALFAHAMAHISGDVQKDKAKETSEETGWGIGAWGKVATAAVTTGLAFFANPVAGAAMAGLNLAIAAISILIYVAIILMFFLCAIEMFVVRLELYTMAVISVMMLPFGVLDQLKFLADKAISAIFNLAIKGMVIAFISVFVAKIVRVYVVKMDKTFNSVSVMSPFLDLTAALQLGLVVIICLWMVRKIPNIVSGLLSGNPNLSGGDLTGAIKSGVNTAVQTAATAAAVGFTMGAAGAGGAMGAKAAGGGKMSQFKKGVSEAGKKGLEIGANKILRDNPLTQGFHKSMNSLLGDNGLARGKKAWNINGEQSARDLLNGLAKPYKTDEKGNIEYQKDKDGNLKYDENGKKIPVPSTGGESKSYDKQAAESSDKAQQAAVATQKEVEKIKEALGILQKDSEKSKETLTKMEQNQQAGQQQILQNQQAAQQQTLNALNALNGNSGVNGGAYVPIINEGTQGKTSTGEIVNYQRNGSNGAGWYNSSGQFVAPSTTGSLDDSQGVHIVDTSSSQSMPTQTVVAGGGGTGGGTTVTGNNYSQGSTGGGGNAKAPTTYTEPQPTPQNPTGTGNRMTDLEKKI